MLTPQSQPSVSMQVTPSGNYLSLALLLGRGTYSFQILYKLYLCLPFMGDKLGLSTAFRPSFTQKNLSFQCRFLNVLLLLADGKTAMWLEYSNTK